MELTLNEALQKAVEAHEAGQVKEVDRLYTAILQAQPKHPDANHNMGVLAVSIGKLQEALPFFKTALEANPSIDQYWLSFIDALIKLDRITDAKAMFDQAKSKVAIGEPFEQLEQRFNALNEVSADPPQDQLNTLINLYRQGQLQQTLDSTKQLLSQFPNSLTLYNIQGSANAGLGQLDSAIDSYKQAIKIQPDFAEAYSNMGVALQSKGDLKAALDNCQQAIKIKPDYAEAYYNMGIAQKDMGDLEAAIDSYKNAIKIKPGYAMAYNNMGIALKDKGDLDAAIDSYKQALKIKPDFSESYNNMGVALKDKGDLDAAIDRYKHAIKIKPDFAESYNNMGAALRDKGNLEASIDSFKKALMIKPDNAGGWSNLILSLQAMKLQTPNIEELLSKIDLKAGSKYVQITKSVLRFSLQQGGKNTESALNEVFSLLSKADNKIIRNPEITKKKPPPKIIGSDNTVALVHFGRSGTGLLHSLIDGHPEVSTMPSIYFSEFFSYSTWDKIVSDGWSKMADRFIATYEVLFDASDPSPIQTKSNTYINCLGQKEGMVNVGDQRDEVLRVDKALFCEELQRLLNLHDHLDAFAFFKLAHAAYDKALKDHNHKNLIFYHIHNPDTHTQLNFVQAAPNANWVMMVREPIQACEAWTEINFHNNDYPRISSKVFTMLFEIDNIIYHKQRSVGVRLEDLKESPRKTIPALCDWMGIEESDSLYEMTAQGKKWWGDPSSPDYAEDGMKPFGTTAIKRKVGSVFTENDRFILRTFFYPFSVRFGYVEENIEQFKADLITIRPMLDEMFGFEKVMAVRTQLDAEQFMKSGSYLYLRSGLIERWNVLAKLHTYPNMIKPLNIN
jgi:tetratricopeptide (TPR) repeat protein